MLNHKYRNPGRTLNLHTFRSACSVTWSAIRKDEGVFHKGSKWIVGKNSHLSLWFDKWLDRGTLRSLIEGPLNQGEEHITLQDIAGFSGWNWQGISFSFPARLLAEIKATPISFSTCDADRITWFSSPSGTFDLKEAYKLATMDLEGSYVDNFDGSWIWKVLTIPKIKCFVLQCCHKSILVNSVLAVRGMNVSALCKLCNTGTESILHVLRDFQVARNHWDSLSPPMPYSLFFGLYIFDWLKHNCCTCKIHSTSNIIWDIIFTFGIWGINRAQKFSHDKD